MANASNHPRGPRVGSLPWTMQRMKPGESLWIEGDVRSLTGVLNRAGVPVESAVFYAVRSTGYMQAETVAIVRLTRKDGGTMATKHAPQYRVRFTIYPD